MNATTFAEKKADNSETPEINISDNNGKKSRKDHSLLVMTAISLLVMAVAVGLIYYFIKTDPTIIHENDQTTEVSENTGFVNPDSIQQLEHDDSNFSVKPAENSNVFIVCGAVFMVVIAGAFVYVKIAESKEDD